MKTYLIDTLNVIHKSSELKKLLNQSKETAVSGLCSRLANHFKKYPTYKATLVIDGKLDVINTFSTNITIIESQNNTADNKIKEIIEKSNKKSNIIVVSSDAEVFKFARIYGIVANESLSFLSEIDTNHSISPKYNQPDKKNPKSKPQRATKKEMSEFMNLFNNELDTKEFDSYRHKK
ncbi:hypothetical protein MASR1M45_06730 [Candidatus Kapaibacterium sp.]